jgi:hypothetical protein
MSETRNGIGFKLEVKLGSFVLFKIGKYNIKQVGGPFT